MNAIHFLSVAVAVMSLSVTANSQDRPDAESVLEVIVDHDVAYLATGRSETLDIYRPKNAPDGARLPGVVLVHGGGWRRGSKRGRREVAIGNALAQRGYVCVSVDYRLAADGQPAPWPQNLMDCKNAVRFLRSQADRYGVDPNRIGAIGASAGGHLASMLGVAGAELGLEPSEPYPGVSSRVCAVVDLYGVTSFLTRRMTDDSGVPQDELKDGPIPGLLGKTRDEDAALWRFASPITHVTKDDPPFLIVHGTADRTVDYLQSRDFAARFDAVGGDAELLLIDGAVHSFGIVDLDKLEAPPGFAERMFAFLEEHVARHEPTPQPERSGRLTELLAADVFESNGRELPYRLFRPERADCGAKFPLVVFLHGAGERGRDNRRQLRHGVRDFVSVENQADRPCFVVAPQCPRGVYWPQRGLDDRCLELVEKLCSELPIDRERVYLTGPSMGGVRHVVCGR